jgi:2Fe-2S ferredoxin
MPWVTVEPTGRKIEIREQETLFDAAERAGWTWPTICHGDGECLTCWVEVVAGIEHVSSVEPVEQQGLNVLTGRRIAAAENRTTLRLACQLRFSGDAVVRRMGPKPPDS